MSAVQTCGCHFGEAFCPVCFPWSYQQSETLLPGNDFSECAVMSCWNVGSVDHSMAETSATWAQNLPSAVEDDARQCELAIMHAYPYDSSSNRCLFESMTHSFDATTMPVNTSTTHPGGHADVHVSIGQQTVASVVQDNLHFPRPSFPTPGCGSYSQDLREGSNKVAIRRQATLRRQPKPCMPCELHPCVQTFTRAADLRRHLLTVHGQGPIYHCPACDYHSARLDKLKEHRGRRHPPSANHVSSPVDTENAV